MKLLIITAVITYEKEIKQLLKQAIESNSFANEINETASILFYAFVKKENIELFMNSVESFNEKQETFSRVHVAVLNIEKTI